MEVKSIFLTMLLIISFLVTQLDILYAEVDSNSMTKWGPKLSDTEIAVIAKLSTPELVEMLKTGDTLHAYAALERLKAGAGLKENFNLLLNIATQTRGDMIVEGLVKPIRSSADAEDKRIIDKYLDFLEAQVKMDKPSISRRQAIRSISKTVYLTSHIRHSWRNKILDPNDKADPNQLMIPYANKRVLNILKQYLDNENVKIRKDTAIWLASIGSNDLSSTQEIKAVLEKQLINEEDMDQDISVKQEMKKVLNNSLKRLEHNITESIKCNEAILLV